MLISICAFILSLHFGRVFGQQVYRAMFALVVPKADLAFTLGKRKEITRTRIREDGNVEESTEVVGDVDALSKYERIKFFLHLMFSA